MHSPTLRLVLIFVISLILVPVGTAATSIRTEAGARMAQAGAVPDSGFFRVRIVAASPDDLLRLEQSGVQILGHDLSSLEGTGGSIAVVVDVEQLEMLAQLGLQLHAIEELNRLLSTQGPEKDWLRASLQPLVDRGVTLQAEKANFEAAGGIDEARARVIRSVQTELRAILAALTAEQKAGIASLASRVEDELAVAASSTPESASVQLSDSTPTPSAPIIAREATPESTSHPKRSEVFSQYPPTMPTGYQVTAPQFTKPAGTDLDVLYISRNPLKKAYSVCYDSEIRPSLCAGTGNETRWPAAGETVTFTAHFMNKGTASSGAFAYKWFVDGVQVKSGTQASMAAGERRTLTYAWTWGHTLQGEKLLGQHTVRFQLDPQNQIVETYETNNSREDRTDALSLVMALTPELYQALEVPIDPSWPFSAEDWLQKQIDALNQTMIQSVYASLPNGVSERVRLDAIIVASEQPTPDRAWDGGFYMIGDDRAFEGYYDRDADVSGALVHELFHQLGVVDMYNLDVALEVLQVRDRNQNPVQMQHNPDRPGIMGDPGIRPRKLDEHSARSLDANKGYRRGYFGEYLFDVPATTRIRVLNVLGQPASNVQVKMYQRTLSGGMLGSLHGSIDDQPEIAVTTDSSGIGTLPNRSSGGTYPTQTGHTLRNNPFGVINVVGNNLVFLVQLQSGTHEEFIWLDITRFNFAAWNSQNTLDLVTHVPAANAPNPPRNLTAKLESGQVRLRWQSSVSSGIRGYRIYATSGPVDAFGVVVNETTQLNNDLDYDYSVPAIGYVVTAIDNQGRESGFSTIFWALRVVNPSDVVVTEGNQRLVLDPQNAYALLIQDDDDSVRDTFGGFDVHLEHSHFINRDSRGGFLISHPGDSYTSQHSVRVLDGQGYLVSEFGETGTGVGQFNYPTGVSSWGPPCTYGGPYTQDAATLLLAHFDGSLAATDGTQAVANGVQFAAGRYGQGARIANSATLSYPVTGSILPEQGAIEFWFQPSWTGPAGAWRVYFEMNAGSAGNPQADANQLLIWNDYFYGGNIPVFYMIGDASSARVDQWTPDWQAGQWYHVAATWKRGEKMRLFVNGQSTQSSAFTPLLSVLPTHMFIGSSAAGAQQVDGVIDELRISSITRFGNSDTCMYRFLVADSENHRLQVFDHEGKPVTSFGAFGAAPGAFDTPRGLVVDDAGRVIVVDSGNDRLQVLGFDGNHFSVLGALQASLLDPVDVQSYGDRVVVSSRGSNEVVVLNRSSAVLARYGDPLDGSQAFAGPEGVAVDSTGSIVVADTGNRRVVSIRNVLPTLTMTPTPTATSSSGATNTPTPTPTSTFTATPPGGSKTKSFQDGVAPNTNYAGTRDSYVSEAQPSSNFGTTTPLIMSGSDPTGSNKDKWALVKWDLSSLCGVVQSGALAFNIGDHAGGQPYELYEVQATWTEAAVNWSNKPARATTVLGTAGPSTTGLTTVNLNADGLAALQRWLNTPNKNYGLYLMDVANTNTMAFDSRERATTSQRPKLTIVFKAAVLKGDPIVPNLTANSAKIMWEVDTFCKGTVKYRVQGTTTWTNKSAATILTGGKWQATANLSGLAANTIYEYQVRASADSVWTSIRTFRTPSASPAENQSLDAPSSSLKPPSGFALAIPSALPAVSDQVVTVPISITLGDGDISGLSFFLNYDQTWLNLEQGDSDEDGLPDAISFNLPGDFTARVRSNPDDLTGKLQIVLSDLTPEMLASLEGPIASISLRAGGVTQPVETAIGFIVDPASVASDPTGNMIPVATTDGSVMISPSAAIYVPLLLYE